MLKDINFDNLEITACTKNITETDEGKHVTVAINMVKLEDSYSHLEGLELAFHKNTLENENKYIKLSCTYTLNEEGQTVLPIKIAYNGTEKYSKRAYYERDLEPSLFEDIQFIETFFDRAPTDVKRLYM
jgi:hypothetical protein